jgi:hypothetical protein
MNRSSSKGAKDLSFQRPLSTRNQAERNKSKEFAFSPFGTKNSKGKEIQSRLQRDRSSKDSKIREITNVGHSANIILSN